MKTESSLGYLTTYSNVKRFLTITNCREVARNLILSAVSPRHMLVSADVHPRWIHPVQRGSLNPLSQHHHLDLYMYGVPETESCRFVVRSSGPRPTVAITLAWPTLSPHPTWLMRVWYQKALVRMIHRGLSSMSLGRYPTLIVISYSGDPLAVNTSTYGVFVAYCQGPLSNSIQEWNYN